MSNEARYQNQQVNDIIIRCGIDMRYKIMDFEEIHVQILLHKNETITSIEQIILKLIRNAKTFSREKIIFFENFFDQLFQFLTKQPATPALTDFFEFFTDVFIVGIHSSNHNVKWMFAKFLNLLVHSKYIERLTQGHLESLLEAGVYLLSDSKLRNKQFALKLISKMQYAPEIKEKAQSIMIQALSIDSFKIIRRNAVELLLLDQFSADFACHRIRDTAKDIRIAILTKLISESYDVLRLERNSRYFLFYNCIFSRQESFKIYLMQLIVPENVDKLSPEDQMAQIYERIISIILSLDIEFFLTFERAFLVFKNMLDLIFENFKAETFRYVIDNTLHQIFALGNRTFANQRFVANLCLFIQLNDFFNRKFEEGQIKEESTNANLNSSHFVKIEAQDDHSNQQSVQNNDRRRSFALNQAPGKNSKAYGDQEDRYSVYLSASHYLESKIPSMKICFDTFDDITRNVDKKSFKVMIELAFRLISHITFDDIYRDKLIAWIRNFIERYTISSIDLDKFITAFNKTLYDKLQVSTDYTEASLFHGPHTYQTLLLSWMLNGNHENRTLIFEFDVIHIILRCFQLYITNENSNFNNLLTALIEKKAKSSEGDDQKIAAIILMTFFLEISKSFSEQTITHISQIISHLFGMVGAVFESNPKFFKFCELAMLKTLGIMKLYSPERMIRMGILHMEILQDKAKEKEEHRIISAAIMLDFFLGHNAEQIEIAKTNLAAQQHQDLLEPDKVLEILKLRLLDEDNVLFRGLLIRGVCRMLLSNKEAFKFYRIEIKELFALMILFWHDKTLRQDSEQTASIVQFLSIFFITMSTTNPADISKVISSLILLLELIQQLKSENKVFGNHYIGFDIKDSHNISEVVKSFVNLTSYTNNKTIADWMFDEYLGLTPQEVLILYLIDPRDGYKEYAQIANELISYCDFWNKSPLSTMKIFLQRLKLLIEPRLKEYSNLQRLQERFQRQIEEYGIDEESANTLTDEEQEINNHLMAKMKDLTNEASMFYKTMKSIRGVIMSDFIDADAKEERDLRSKRKVKKIQKD